MYFSKSPPVQVATAVHTRSEFTELGVDWYCVAGSHIVRGTHSRSEVREGGTFSYSASEHSVRVSAWVGDAVGAGVGVLVGDGVGDGDGEALGPADGDAVGDEDGASVGAADGAEVWRMLGSSGAGLGASVAAGAVLGEPVGATVSV